MTTVEQVALAGNVCGVIGTAIVVWPAIKATRLFRLVERGKEAARRIPQGSTTSTSWLQEVTRDFKGMQEQWRPRDAWLLFLGLFFTALSDLLPLAKAWWNLPP